MEHSEIVAPCLISAGVDLLQLIPTYVQRLPTTYQVRWAAKAHSSGPFGKVDAQAQAESWAAHQHCIRSMLGSGKVYPVVSVPADMPRICTRVTGGFITITISRPAQVAREESYTSWARRSLAVDHVADSTTTLVLL